MLSVDIVADDEVRMCGSNIQLVAQLADVQLHDGIQQEADVLMFLLLIPLPSGK